MFTAPGRGGGARRLVYETPSMPALPSRGLTLFVDADDTLWENNVYFEAIVADYVALAGHHGCPPDEARARFLDVERDRVRRFGYGISNFQSSLELACEGLAAGQVDTSRFAALCTALRRRAGAHLD